MLLNQGHIKTYLRLIKDYKDSNLYDRDSPPAKAFLPI